jgi:hypothetical protein
MLTVAISRNSDVGEFLGSIKTKAREPEDACIAEI